MSQALIISVGGTIEPIISSVTEHRPSLVIFFASEKTIEAVGEIKACLRRNNLEFANRNIMIPDPEDLESCYNKAIECADIALAGGRSASDVVVDFTGGTKAMTAALTLATVGKGFVFSYVGGSERSKEGRGVVATGSERIVRRRDPFALYAVHERRRLVQYFNCYQFQAAQALARELQARPVLEADRAAFEFIGEVAAGYEAWDRFLLDRAQERLRAALTKWRPAIRASAGFRYASLEPRLDAHVERLGEVLSRTRGLKQVHSLLAEELLANASRRAEEGKYDDAIVRLYRALELGGQIAIQRTLGCGTDQVPVDQVPVSIREEYHRKYQDRENPAMLQTPLEATYRLLDALDQPEGKEFMAQSAEIKKIQSARNASWLAHGLTPCRDQTYGTLSALVRNILAIVPGPDFPKLEESA